jgi:hypothetical protein
VQGRNSLRDNPFIAPASKPQEGAGVGLPNGPWSHDGEIPGDNEAIGIASEKALIAADESGRMDRGLVATQDRLGLRRAVVDGH